MRLQQAPTEQVRTRAPSRMPATRARYRGRAQSTAGRMGGPRWRSTRAGLFSSAWLATLRLRRSAALLLAVVLGMLVAVVLVCTVPLYDSLVSDIQLQRGLNTADPISRNVEVQVQSNALAPSLRTSADGTVSSLAHQHLTSFVTPNSTYFIVADDTLLTRAGANSFDPTHAKTPVVRFQAFDYASAGTHMHFVAGGPPVSGSPGGAMQAAVTQQMAKDNNLSVGSTIAVTEFGNHSVQFTVTVSGIWVPDTSDSYWNGQSFNPQAANNGPTIYTIQLTYGDLFAGLAPFTGLGMTQHWVYYTQPSAITIGTLDDVRAELGRFSSQVNGALIGTQGTTHVAVLGELSSLLGDVDQQQALLSLPLYVIVAQIVALALLFVGAMAGLLIEGQSQDIATLKSRGVSGLQTLFVFTAQGVLLGAVAVALGPLLAGPLALALIRWFVPTAVLQSAGVTPEYLASIATPQAALLPAIAGALLGVLTVAATARQRARLEVLAFRREQARPSRQPLWRRYYLDLALAVLCVVGYLDLDQFGSASTRLQLGGGSSPLLLAAPALLLIAGALLVLRFIPVGAAFGARLAARGRGFTTMLAFAQVERNPNRYTRMTLLLVLAVGLGLFAVTFDASLAQNASDRAAYDTGADVRLQMNGAEPADVAPKLVTQLQALPGVRTVAGMYRSRATTSVDEGSSTTDMLGIDPATFDQVALGTSWRADYSSTPLPAMLGELSSHAHGPTAGTADAPLYALVSQTFADHLSLRAGDRFTMQLDETAPGGTSFVVGRIIQDFPTLYPERSEGGFVVVNLSDYLGAIQANLSGAGTTVGPNEFWLKLSADAAQHVAFLTALHQHPELDVNTIYDLRAAQVAAASNPVGTGIRGLLVVGAITAALLAVLGSVIQSLLATQQRATQFAILRTLGTARRQLTGLLLSEQAVVYLFGLVGGTLLGLLLTSATLPFLQFSDTVVDPTRLGVPPYQLVFNPNGMLVFYATLLAAFGLALAIAARYAATIGLGQALRLGED